MILGVVGDTHNRILNVEIIVDLFNSYEVDTVIHTGDITQAKTLSKFSRLNCKLLGVYGNNDLEEKGLEKVAKEKGFSLCNPPLFLSRGGKKIAIFHEPDEIEEIIYKKPYLDLIIHGHTHRYRNEIIKGVKIFNPGECAGFQKGKNSIGLINLDNLTIKRIFF